MSTPTYNPANYWEGPAFYYESPPASNAPAASNVLYSASATPASSPESTAGFTVNPIALNSNTADLVSSLNSQAFNYLSGVQSATPNALQLSQSTTGFYGNFANNLNSFWAPYYSQANQNAFTLGQIEAANQSAQISSAPQGK